MFFLCYKQVLLTSATNKIGSYLSNNNVYFSGISLFFSCVANKVRGHRYSENANVANVFDVANV